MWGEVSKSRSESNLSAVAISHARVNLRRYGLPKDTRAKMNLCASEASMPLD